MQECKTRHPKSRRHDKAAGHARRATHVRGVLSRAASRRRCLDVLKQCILGTAVKRSARPRRRQLPLLRPDAALACPRRTHRCAAAERNCRTAQRAFRAVAMAPRTGTCTRASPASLSTPGWRGRHIPARLLAVEQRNAHRLLVGRATTSSTQAAIGEARHRHRAGADLAPGGGNFWPPRPSQTTQIGHGRDRKRGAS
jgi:hypothetical protein